MVELRLLGGATVNDRRGAPAGLASHRAPVAILALLATAPSRTLSRVKLVGLLWPEAPESKGRNRLNTYVHRIRRELGDPVLQSLGHDIRLVGDGIACDVWAFRSALARGDARAAVETYRGPLLDGFSLDGSVEFEHWLDLERDRVRRAYLGALERLGGVAELRGDLEEAVHWWRARHEDDPFDARGAVRLVQALDACGCRAEALQVGLAHIDRGRVELGVGGDPAMVALLSALRTPRPTISGPKEDEAAAGEPIPSRPNPPPLGAAPTRSVPSGAARTPRRRSRRLATAATLGVVAVGVFTLGVLTVAGIASGGGWFGGAVHEHETERSAARGSVPGATAFELYLRGRALDRGPDPAGTRSRKLELYRRVLALEPSFSEAWASLADAYLENAWAGGDPGVWTDSAAVAARRALELDPDLSDAHAQLGDVYWTLDRVDEARASYVRALEIDPTHWEAMNNLLTMLDRQGRLADRMGWLDRFRAIWPESPDPVGRLALANADLGRRDVAESWIEYGRHKGYDVAGAELDLNLLRSGDLERARQVADELGSAAAHETSFGIVRRYAALALYEDDLVAARRLYESLYPGVTAASEPLFRGLLWDPLALAHTLIRSGEVERAHAIAREVIDAARTSAADPDHSLRHRLAVAHLILGDRDASVAWLEDSVDRGFRAPRLLETVPTLEGLRGDPRFRALIERLERSVAVERRRVEREGWGLPPRHEPPTAEKPTRRGSY